MKQLILLLLLAGSCLNKTNYFTFEQVSLDEVEDIEAHFQSEQKNINTPIYVSADYLPEAYELDLSPYPLIYVRKDNSFKPIPEVDIVYHYTELDSILRLITYTWDSKKIGDKLQDINSDYDNKLAEFTDKYDSLQSEISSTLGPPAQSDPDVKKVQEKDYGEWLEKSAKWQKDNMIVELKLIFTQGIKKLGTHSIRVKVYWIS